MSEKSLFKKSFLLGRLIWVKGDQTKSNRDKLNDLLLECGILPSEVLRINSIQFIDLFSRGLTRDLITRYEVVMIHGFEDLVSGEANALLRTIQSFRELQVGHSLQLILASSSCISPELNRFEQFAPTEVLMDSESEDPGEMNERVHNLLGLAMRITGVQVNRISERAAVFLENFLREEGEHDALVLILKGIGRLKSLELTLSDLIPRVSYPQDEGCGAENARI